MKSAIWSERSLAPDHPHLQVIEYQGSMIGKKKSKRIFEFTNMKTSTEFNVYQSDLNSLVRAIKERLFYVSDGMGGFVTPPVPDDTAFSAGLKEEFEYFKNVVQYTAPLTKSQFLGAYDGRRRTIYESAYNSLLHTPARAEDAEVKYFVKTEKVNFTKKKNPAPRGISPRSPRYHVLLGPFIKRIEHTVYKLVDDMFGSPTIMKGRNMLERGKVCKGHWDSFNEPVAIGLDASRFDQHVSVDALEWEHSIYKLFFPYDKDFHRLLKLQIVNKGKGFAYNGKIRFKKHGSRMSGDMNTALGNCLLMSMIVHSYGRQNLQKFRLMNDGDDCVLFIEKKDISKLSNLKQHFLQFGFNVITEDPCFEMEKIEFCQSQPVRISEKETVFVRSMPVTLSKDAVSIKPLDNVVLAKRWGKDIGLCGLSLTSGIPIAQEWYEGFISAAGDVDPLANDPTQDTGMRRLAKGMNKKYRTPNPTTRFSFWLAFGIEPDKQLVYEGVIKNRKVDYLYDPQCNQCNLNIY